MNIIIEGFPLIKEIPEGEWTPTSHIREMVLTDRESEIIITSLIQKWVPVGVSTSSPFWMNVGKAEVDLKKFEEMA